MKSLALSDRVLALPNSDDQFILDTDASDVSVGAELSQLQDNVERPIAYASKVLTDPQRKYCTTRKELLAVIIFTRQFRHYLLGRPVIIRTDHNSLVWLMRFKNPQGQIARWLEELAQFDLKIVHRKGEKHINADALSRIPDPLEFCKCYDAGKDLDRLPCGGCKFCTRAQEQWGSFDTDVDDVVPLTIRAVSIPNDQLDDELSMYSTQELIDHQHNDPDLKDVIDWLANDEEPSQEELAIASRAVKHLWQCRTQLHLQNGVLYYHWIGDPKDGYRLVVPHSLKDEVLKLCHDHKLASHPGIHKTYERVSKSFFWHAMRRDIDLYVRTCKQCSQNKKPSVRPKAAMQNYRVGAPMERVHIDLLGPFNESEEGNKYIVVIVDQFTKWMECYAVPDQSAETVCQVLVKNCLSKLGPPRTIHSDQGRNFESEIFQQVCRAFEIAKTRTTPYRPSSNGQVERMNRIILQSIRCYLGGHIRKWDKHLHLLGMAVRSTINRSTCFTPNFLMLGREVALPKDLFGAISNNDDESLPGYVKELLQRMRDAHEAARANLKSSMKREKMYYDHKLRQKFFEVGDLVYKLDTTTKVGQSSKLKPIYIGPYLVTKVISPVLYQISDRKGDNVIHHDRLRKCIDRVIPMWIRRKRSELLQSLDDDFLSPENNTDADETLPYQDPDFQADGADDIQDTDGSNASGVDQNIDDTPRSRNNDMDLEDVFFLGDLFEETAPMRTSRGRRVRRPRYLDDYDND